MMTLKIIHTDINGGRTTYLFSGERFLHTEAESTDHCMDFEEEDDYFVVGELSKSSSVQPFVWSCVKLFDGDDYQTINILPKSECFIMSEGKTVDTFACYYK